LSGRFNTSLKVSGSEGKFLLLEMLLSAKNVRHLSENARPLPFNCWGKEDVQLAPVSHSESLESISES